jgi:hypothetical protein
MKLEGKMRNQLLVALIISFTFTACSSVPSKQSLRVSPDAEQKISQMAHMGIIADVCLFKDVLGDDDYWVVEESRSAAKHMLEATKTSLAGKGFAVGYAEAPFVGAFKSREKPFKVSARSGDEVTDRYPPLFESAVLDSNPAYREALLTIIPRLLVAPGHPDICCSSADTKDHMTTIAKNTGGDATLFLIGHGTIVSTGKQLTQGLATGLLTAALTLGTVSIMSYNVSAMDTYAVLVDNDTGRILWANAVRLKGDGFTDQSYYEADRWQRSVLNYFPSKTPGQEISVAASAIDSKSVPGKDAAQLPGTQQTDVVKEVPERN